MGNFILFILQIAAGSLGAILILVSIVLFYYRIKSVAYVVLVIGVLLIAPSILLPLSLKGYDWVSHEIEKGAMLRAIDRHDLDNIKEMVETGENVNKASEYYTITPLLYAVTKSDYEVVRYLLSANADVNQENEFFKCTPLTRAISKGDIQILKLLLKKGAKLNWVIGGGTELHFAVSNTDNVEIVRLLILNGSDVNSLNKSQSTPLIVAISSTIRGYPPKANLSIIRFLLDSGAKVNGVNIMNKSALDYAVEFNNQDLVKVLRKYGAKTAEEIRRDEPELQR